eukprot:SAG31_NODE_20454_length_574_cov_0.692632_2_plen_61_part_00
MASAATTGCSSSMTHSRLIKVRSGHMAKGRHRMGLLFGAVLAARLFHGGANAARTSMVLK